MATTPPEYTPELDQATLDALLRKIKDQYGADVASAHGDATARGLTGSTYEATRLGLADKSSISATADAMTNFALQKASMQREERLAKEQRDFSASEAQKSRDFSGGESDKDRVFQDSQRKLQDEYLSLENQKNQAFQSGETEKAMSFQAQQNELERQNQENISKQQSRQATQGAIGQLAGNLGGAYILHGMGGGGAAAGAGGAAGAGAAGAPTASTLFGGSGGSLAGSALGGAAGIVGGAYAGQTLADHIFGQSYNNNKAVSRGGKVGSAAGAGVGTALFGPLGGVAGGAIGGVVGSAVGKPVAKIAANVKSIFCFLAGTPVQMVNGETKKIEDILLGDETKGGRVTSVRMAEADDVYDYLGIRVTGEHAVFENGVWVRVKNSKSAIPMTGVPHNVLSIVTEDHRIYIPTPRHGHITFADEHETDYYEDLSIEQSLDVLNKMEIAHNG